jgi:hypothetical protein
LSKSSTSSPLKFFYQTQRTHTKVQKHKNTLARRLLKVLAQLACASAMILKIYNTLGHLYQATRGKITIRFIYLVVSEIKQIINYVRQEVNLSLLFRKLITFLSP